MLKVSFNLKHYYHINTLSCFFPSSYIIEQGVCYLVLCEAAFPKKLAFAYLEDLHSEFDEQHGKKVPTVSRPYSFIEFGKIGAEFLYSGSSTVEKLIILTCFPLECLGRFDSFPSPNLPFFFLLNGESFILSSKFIESCPFPCSACAFCCLV